MPDLNGWPLLCIVLMVAVTVANHLLEKGDR